MSEKDFRVKKGLRVEGTGDSSIAGNLGIGTTSPVSTLHLTSGSGYFKVDTDGSNTYLKSDFNMNYYADFDGANSVDYQNHKFFTDGTNERMRITSAGKVGIGTTSPSSQLDIRGAAGSPGHLTLATDELTVVDGDILGRIDFRAPAETGADALLVSASIWAEADGAFDATNNPTELVFATGASETASEKMRITSDGIVTATTFSGALSGNATSATSATTATHVAGGALGSILYQSASATSVLLAGHTTASKAFLSQTGTGSGSAVPAWGLLVSGDIPDNAADTSGTAAAATLAAKATALNTTSNGIVKTTSGDGTISIGSLLSGDIPANAANTSGTAAGLSSTLVVASGGTGATTLTSNSLLTGNGTSAIVAESALTFDGTNLYVQSATPRIYLSDTDESSADGSSLLITKSGTISYVYDRQTSSKLYLGAADDSDILVIDGANARVGIGTTSPSGSLTIDKDVTGDIDLVSSAALHINYDSSGSAAAGGQDNEQVAIYIDQDSSATGSVGGGDEIRNYGIYLDQRQTGNAYYQDGIKVYQEAEMSAAHTLHHVAGIYTTTLSQMTHASATIASSYGAYHSLNIAKTGTNTNNYGIYQYTEVNNDRESDVGTIYGIYSQVDIEGSNSNTISTGSIFGLRSTIDHNDTSVTTATGYLGYFDYDTDGGNVGTAYGIYVNNEDKNYFSGNVGIGESSPLFASGGGLHIYDSTQANVRLEDAAGEYFDVAMQNGDAYLINRVADGFLSLRTNSTERIRILSGGNVGIGTDAAGTTLHVAGSTTIDDNLTVGGTSTSKITLNGNDALVAGQFSAEGTAGSYIYSLALGTSSVSSTSGKIITSGNVESASLTSTTLNIDNNHYVDRLTGVTAVGVAINGSNYVKATLDADSHRFAYSYVPVGDLANGAAQELFRFNVANASYYKYQACKIFIRGQDTTTSAYFQQTTSIAVGPASVYQSTTDRMDAAMGGTVSAWNDQKITLVATYVGGGNDYVTVSIQNDTGATITAAGFRVAWSAELLKMDAIPS
tara:strand:+ start:14904 stop:17969 length:3066 start_codon:yes stop_codon:yes gene_type:complete